MKNFFKDIGKQLKKMACSVVIFGILLIILSVILFICFLAGEDWLCVWAISAFAAGLISINWAYFIYAFGQITDDVHTLKKNSTNNSEHFEDLPRL